MSSFNGGCKYGCIFSALFWLVFLIFIFYFFSEILFRPHRCKSGGFFIDNQLLINFQCFLKNKNAIF